MRSCSPWRARRIRSSRISRSRVSLEICDSQRKFRETERHLSEILHGVLSECDASSHRFSSLNTIYSARLEFGHTYDRSFTERAYYQRRRFDHCLAALFGGRICLGKIQRAAPEVWEKSRRVRFLPLHGDARKLWRVQSERFPARHALLPQERRSYRRATAHFHWRTKQRARTTRAPRAKGVRTAVR